MNETTAISGYRWTNAQLGCSHDYLLPTVLSELARLRTGLPAGEGGDCLNWVAAMAVSPRC